MKQIKFRLLSLMIPVLLLTGAKGYSGSFATQMQKQELIQMDVMENDGRYILWRSTDYYKVSEPISFKCRNGKITHVFISFDHGGTYRDETKRFYVKAGDENALQLNRENFPKGDLCIKFRTRSGLITRESRDYRIRI